MKIISWNVNGLKSILNKGFLEFVREFHPDVLCLQETRSPKEMPPVDLPGYKQYWNHAKKPGYSGTAIFTLKDPLQWINGIGMAKHDGEGRVITVEFRDFFLVNVYVPNAKRGLERLPYRTRDWDVDFLKYLKKIEERKPVIFGGDLNVAHKEIDLARPEGNEQNHGFTKEERAGFDNLIKAGFIDTFREFEKDRGHYTWWSRMGNCRQRNIGWRIDYFLVSASLRPRLKNASILKDVSGSDHCPVSLEII
ncbi:MAG TPA: exodeoxyribonuclease III [Candidatus Omnitrophica bacterium]|nr:MAG: exodeoxyribonuclease III [Omnitrophica WOR_2 bacterium GWA2_45_18]HBR15083.1 exodeoxyribonuclease III [Candidatus Omnitrophota bacterium]